MKRKCIETLTAERDRAYSAWSDMEYRVKRAQNDGTDYRLLPLMQGQARFLYAEYESKAALVTARRVLDIVEEGVR